MGLDIHYCEDSGRLCCTGAMTFRHIVDAKVTLLQHQNRALDLSRVKSLDGAGLQLLMLAWRDAGLYVTAASPAVELTLSLCGMQQLREPRP